MRSSDGMLERVTLCDRTVVTLERQREGDTSTPLIVELIRDLLSQMR